MEKLTQPILEVPWPAVIPVVLMLLVGLVLWVAGRRVLRTSFAAAGLILGGVLGWAATDLDVVAAMTVPAWVFAVVGSVLAAIVFAAAYRMVLAGSIALLLATLAPLGVWTAAELGALPLQGGETVAQKPLFAGTTTATTNEPATDLDRWLEDVFGVPGEEPPPAGDEEPAPVPAPAEGEADANPWRQWWDNAADVLVSVPVTIWQETPEPLRWSVVAAAAVGGLLGLVLGAAAPSFSASVVTALGGSVIMISSAWTLAARLEAPPDRWLPTTPKAILAWWIALSVIGLGIQWMLRARRADKSAS
ncbi:MAG: hypothetical protein ACYSU7_03640 [Planctomycetota bacterium]|jgi:hypothetical protein